VCASHFIFHISSLIIPFMLTPINKKSKQGNILLFCRLTKADFYAIL